MHHILCLCKPQQRRSTAHALYVSPCVCPSAGACCLWVPFIITSQVFFARGIFGTGCNCSPLERGNTGGWTVVGKPQAEGGLCFPPRRQSWSLGTAQHGMGGDSIALAVRTDGCGALELLQPPAGPEQGRKCAYAQRRKGGKLCVEASDVGSAVTPI